MREMKDSGVEWIGSVPLSWQTLTIGSLFKVRNEKVNDVDYPPLSVSKRGIVPQMENVAKSDASDNRKMVLTNDFVINSRSDRKQSCGVSPLDGSVSLINIVLYPAKNAPIISAYLNYLMKNHGFAEEYYRWGHGIVADLWTTRWQEMKSILLPIPREEEQQKILDKISEKTEKVDTLIANVQTQIEKLKAYKQSLITEVVTKGLDPTVPMKDSGVEWIGEIPEHWSVAALKYFTDILPGYAFSSNDFHAEAGIPLLRGVNVTPNGIRWDDTVYWNKEITDKLKPFILQLDDIVVGLDRPWISEGTRITRMTEKDLPSLLLQRVCRIRVKASMDSRWVFLGIASNAFKESLSTETTGISVPHISTKQIGDFIVALPSMETQKEICDFIDKKRSQIDRLITSKQAKIEKLEQYKRSLIYEYVTGKKEVRI